MMAQHAATQCLLPLVDLRDETTARPARRRRHSAPSRLTGRPLDTRATRPIREAHRAAPVARSAAMPAIATMPHRTTVTFGGVLARGRELLPGGRAPRLAPELPVAIHTQTTQPESAIYRTLAALAAALWAGIDVLLLAGRVDECDGAQAPTRT